jgi:RNA polymerase-binding transcription factor
MATQLDMRARRTGDARGGEPADLTAEQVSELRKALETRRTTIVTAIESRQIEERATEGARDVGDEMDDATSEGNNSMASKLLERDVRLLNEIDRALAKLDEGTYGLCEGTEEPIGYARLRLQPWARYSVGYQEELEREERMRGGRG